MTSSCSLRYPALIRSSSVPSSFSFSFSLCSLRSTTPPPLPPRPSLRGQSLLLALLYALKASSLPFPLLALFRSPFLPLSNSLSPSLALAPFLVISPPSLSAFSLRLLSPPFLRFRPPGSRPDSGARIQLILNPPLNRRSIFAQSSSPSNSSLLSRAFSLWPLSSSL